MSSISNLFLKEVDEEAKPEEQYIVDLKELDQYKTKNDSKVILEDLQKTMELEQIKEEDLIPNNNSSKEYVLPRYFKTY